MEDSTVREFGSPDEPEEKDDEAAPAGESPVVVEVWKSMSWHTRILAGVVIYLGMAYCVAILYAFKRRQRWRESSSLQMQTFHNNSGLGTAHHPYKDEIDDAESIGRAS